MSVKKKTVKTRAADVNHAGIPPAIAHLFAKMETQLEHIQEQIARLTAEKDFSKRQTAEHEAQNAKRRSQNAEHRAQNAEMEAQRAAQVAALEAQIAAQREQSAQLERQWKEQSAQIAVQREKNAQIERQLQRQVAQLQNSDPWAVGRDPYFAANSAHCATTDDFPRTTDHCAATTAYNLQPTAYSKKPQVVSPFEKADSLTRQTFPVPVVTSAFASGPYTITINWLPVAGADGYSLRFATDPELTHYVSSTVAATITGMTRTGLLPDTKYYVMIRANAASPDTASNYSVPIEIVTPSESQSGIVGEMQNGLNGLHDVYDRLTDLLPGDDHLNLSPVERRRLQNAGARRYGFIDQVSDTSGQYPQFWPAYNGTATAAQERLKELLRQIEVLRNLLLFFETGTRHVLDQLLQVSNEAFQLAGTYYRAVRNAARDQNPEAEAVFRMLRLFWLRRRTQSDSPTQRQAIRDAKAIQRGTKNGSLTVYHESDTVVKGAKGVIDDTRPARKHTGERVVETDDEDFDDDDGYFDD